MCGVCVCYLRAPGEAGPYYSRQELAVYGGGRDDLRRGHGGDALKGLLLGILVLHGNKHTLFQVLHGLMISHQPMTLHSVVEGGKFLKFYRRTEET